MRALSELLRVGAGLDTTRVIDHIIDDHDQANEVDRVRAGDLLQRADNRAVERLAGASQPWYQALRARLAAVGVLDAQLAELHHLASKLRAGGPARSTSSGCQAWAIR